MINLHRHDAITDASAEANVDFKPSAETYKGMAAFSRRIIEFLATDRTTLFYFVRYVV